MAQWPINGLISEYTIIYSTCTDARTHTNTNTYNWIGRERERERVSERVSASKPFPDLLLVGQILADQPHTRRRRLCW